MSALQSARCCSLAFRLNVAPKQRGGRDRDHKTEPIAARCGRLVTLLRSALAEGVSSRHPFRGKKRHSSPATRAARCRIRRGGDPSRNPGRIIPPEADTAQRAFQRRCGFRSRAGLEPRSLLIDPAWRTSCWTTSMGRGWRLSRVHVFADEAGNFDWSRGPSASRWYILTTVTLPDHSVGNALQDLRRQLMWEGVDLAREFPRHRGPASGS